MDEFRQCDHGRLPTRQTLRKHRVVISVAMLVVALCGCDRDVLSSQAPQPAPQRSVPVHIVMYNVHLLPGIAANVAGKRSKPDYRAQSIAKKFADCDIIGICEAFDRDHSQTLIDTFQANASTPFAIAKGPERSGLHLVGSGLILFSRFPIEETHTITYKHASWFLSAGFKADGLAAKGVLHARIRLDDDSRAVIDCFLTHLESRSRQARDHQIEELAGFIALHSCEDNPIVVLGDFNVASDSFSESENADHDTPYQRLLNALRHNGKKLVDVGHIMHPGRGGTSDPMAEDGGDRIDYIFVSDVKATDNGRLEPKVACTLLMLDDNVPEGSLSDHLAVTCQSEFCWTVEASHDPTSRGD